MSFALTARQYTGLALGCGMLVSAAANGAVVGFAGVQTDLRTNGGDWRTTTIVKPLDLDGDNVYGTAGYRMFGGAALSSLPSFISSISTPGSTYLGNGRYIPLDDPSATPGPSVPDVSTGTTNPGTGDVFSFTIASNAVLGSSFRVELIDDNLDSTFYNATSFRIRGTGTTTGDSGFHLVTSNNQNPDAYVFEIFGAVPGDTFTVSGTAGGGGTVTIGAIGFDVPEPASAATVLIGGAGLLAARRRR